VRFILQDSKEEYVRLLDRAAAKIATTVPASSPPDPFIRKCAGFPPWFIDVMVDRHRASSSARVDDEHALAE
jgi:hypothetical protein